MIDSNQQPRWVGALGDWLDPKSFLSDGWAWFTENYQIALAYTGTSPKDKNEPHPKEPIQSENTPSPEVVNSSWPSTKAEELSLRAEQQIRRAFDCSIGQSVDEAINHYEEARSIYHEMGNTQKEAETLCR